MGRQSLDSAIRVHASTFPRSSRRVKFRAAAGVGPSVASDPRLEPVPSGTTGSAQKSRCPTAESTICGNLVVGPDFASKGGRSISYEVPHAIENSSRPVGRHRLSSADRLFELRQRTGRTGSEYARSTAPNAVVWRPHL